MPSIWDDLKKTVKEGLSVAAAKTEEYTKLGKAKLDQHGLQKNLNTVLQQIGNEVYNLITEGGKGSIPQNPAVKQLVEQVKGLKQAILDKEKEIEAIKKGSVQPATGTSDETEPSPEVKKDSE